MNHAFHRRLRLRRAQLALPASALVLSVFAFTSDCSAEPASPADASVQSSADSLRPFFAFEASIFLMPNEDASGAGALFRLDLGVDVLDRCQADLSDLRIFDSSNREIPYRVAHLPLPQESYEVMQSLPSEITDAKRNRNADLAFESYQVTVPKEVQDDPTGWVLAMKVAAPRFVREVLLSNSSLAEEMMTGPKPGTRVPDVVASSIFRLPKAGAERTFVPLATKVGPTLHVLLASKIGLFPGPRLPAGMLDDPGVVLALEPRFAFEKRKTSPALAGLIVPLEQIGRSEVKNKTVLTLSRPSGIVPHTLRIDTGTPAFHRKVEVFDDRKRIAEETIFRLPTAAPAEKLDIALASASASSSPGGGNRKALRVEITNEDSPALDDVRVTAVVRQPTLVFAMRPLGPSAPSGMLRMGGGRLRPPHYDLDAVVFDEKASGETVLALPKARLGTIVRNDHFLAQSSLSSLMRAGIKVDARLYTKQRVLAFAPSPDGLNAIRLSPLDVAAMRSDMADLRIIDHEGKQWPLLIDDAAAEEVWTELAIEPQGTRNGQSTYEVVLPTKAMTIDRLEVSSVTPFFERNLTVTASPAPEGGPGRVLFDGPFSRRSGGPPTEVQVSPARLDALALVIRDGENAPLEKVAVRARSLVPTVFAIAPAGSYRMLMGYPEAQPPNYDVENSRELLAKVASSPATTGPLVDNPDFRARARLGAGEGPQHLLLWGALGLAVIVLASVTLRMVRREGEPPPAADQ